MFGDKHEYYLAAANSGPRWRLSLGRLNYCDRRPSTAYLAEVQSKIATAKAFTKLGPVCSWHACVAGRRCVVCFWCACGCDSLPHCWKQQMGSRARFLNKLCIFQEGAVSCECSVQPKPDNLCVPDIVHMCPSFADGCNMHSDAWEPCLIVGHALGEK